MLLSIHSANPEPRKIQRALDALQSGEVIAYPTDTVYGLGCDMMNKKAIDRLYSIKGVNASHPLAFICPDLANIARYAVVENATYRVLRHFLPGPYCFILPASHEVPRLMQSRRKTVGIRIPDHGVPCALARVLGRPIVSTSAQREGEDPHVDPREIDHAFRGLGLVLDGGGGGLVPTTVIDLTKSPPEIVRRGAGSTEEFE
jgi:tRNA threonylcarbamoyl adenosine modification protein (Sua5/YciO/YrdC/YwlC family)